MGLDLTIRKQHNMTTDEKGRTTFQVTVLANLRNCYTILEKLGNRLEWGFGNCATYSFDEGTFHAILKELKKEFEQNQDGDLKYEIEKLEEFIKEQGLVAQEPSEEDKKYGTGENYGETFEVHAWW
jgi:hypothetical protein